MIDDGRPAHRIDITIKSASSCINQVAYAGIFRFQGRIVVDCDAVKIIGIAVDVYGCIGFTWQSQHPAMAIEKASCVLCARRKDTDQGRYDDHQI